MGRATKSKPRKASDRAAPDAALIGHCIAYAQQIAAFHAGFKADPDGNNTHAAARGDIHMGAALEALVAAAKIRPKGVMGLDAKARIMAMILDDDVHTMEAVSEAFYRQFVIDVRRFLGPIVETEWLSELEAKGYRCPYRCGRAPSWDPDGYTQS